MKPLKVLYLTTLNLLLVSCDKEGPGDTPRTTVSGYVYEKDTQKPLEEIPVKLVDMGGGALGMAGGGSANSSQAVFVTGPDGYYHFEFEGDGSYGIFSDGRWPEYSHLPGYKPVNKGEHNEISFTLQPQAWFRLHVQNTQPVDYLDEITISVGNGQSLTFYGKHVNEYTSYIRKWGNTDYELFWSVTRTSKGTELYDTTFYLGGEDTSYVEILY